MKREAVHRLSSCALFQGSSLEALQNLLPRLEIRQMEYREKDIVVWEDTPIASIAVVVRGQFVASKFGNEKSPQTMNIFYPGDILGLPEYMSTPKTWARTVTCAKAGTVLWFNLTPVLTDVSVENADLRLWLMSNIATILADDMIRQLYRIEVISTNPLKDRILLFLRIQQEKHAQEWIRLRMNRGQFADYLCVDRATLSRELKKMEAANILQLRGDREYRILELSTEQSS